MCENEVFARPLLKDKWKGILSTERLEPMCTDVLNTAWEQECVQFGKSADEMAVYAKCLRQSVDPFAEEGTGKRMRCTRAVTP